MDWNRIEGNWKQMKGAVKQQWGKLTDDDLTQINGSQEKLEGIIQERYGIARDETRKQIDAWYQNQTGNKRTMRARGARASRQASQPRSRDTQANRKSLGSPVTLDLAAELIGNRDSRQHVAESQAAVRRGDRGTAAFGPVEPRSSRPRPQRRRRPIPCRRRGRRIWSHWSRIRAAAKRGW